MFFIEANVRFTRFFLVSVHGVASYATVNERPMRGREAVL